MTLVEWDSSVSPLEVAEVLNVTEHFQIRFALLKMVFSNTLIFKFKFHIYFTFFYILNIFLNINIIKILNKYNLNFKLTLITILKLK